MKWHAGELYFIDNDSRVLQTHITVYNATKLSAATEGYRSSRGYCDIVLYLHGWVPMIRSTPGGQFYGSDSQTPDISLEIVSGHLKHEMNKDILGHDSSTNTLSCNTN